MPSIYLDFTELSQYGLAPTTTAAQIQQASGLIDGFLKRPEGLVWVPDYAGLPCYMAAAAPLYSFQSAGSISPGINVNVPFVTVIPPLNDTIGEVVILDRANPSLVEACTVSAVSASGVWQFANVVNSHSSNCTIETGLTITEERALATKRSIMRVSRPPLRILSGLGRYGYGRRTDQAAGMYNEINLLAAIQAFGGPPMWVPWDVTLAGVSTITHEIWVPAGLLLAYFSECRVRYVSGFPQNNIPPIIKQATAVAVQSFINQPDLTGNIKQFKAGDTLIQRFADTIIDGDTRRMLLEYRAKLMI